MTDQRDIPLGKVCEHGQLARQCDRCEAAAEIAELRAEVLRLKAAEAKAERRAVMFGDVISSHCIAMQAAVIDAELRDPEAGMRWIKNTLRGPGLLPDIDEALGMVGDGKDTLAAQAWFDAKTAEHEAFRAAHPGPAAAGRRRHAAEPGAHRRPCGKRVLQLVPLPTRRRRHAAGAEGMSATYSVLTIQDLLAVPDDKRDACMRDLLYALSLHELAYGEEAKSVGIGALAWTDDDNPSVDLHDGNGDLLLRLSVTRADAQEQKP